MTEINNKLSVKLLAAAMAAVLSQMAFAAEEDKEYSLDNETAEALAQQEDDASQEKNLEEVFDATEEEYALRKQSNVNLFYSFGYSYSRSDSINTPTDSDGSIRAVQVIPQASHSFNNTLSLSYGLLDNLTVSGSFPFVYRNDSTKGLDKAGIGDFSTSVRWQPFPAKRGGLNTTLFTSMKFPTGDSPYTLNPQTDLATGSGYFTLTAGSSFSQVIDPAIVFANVSYSVNNDVEGINQTIASGTGGQTRELNKLRPGDNFGASMGLAFSITYDLSLNLSTSLGYNMSSIYEFSDGAQASSGDSFTALFNASLGMRMSPKTIVNYNFGFGLTEDAPDVTLGVSMPINFLGFK
ncbi:MAG: transporter [Pseudomonadota bacterium]|nr:transporter [Pseudomonadota bacterium]